MGRGPGIRILGGDPSYRDFLNRKSQCETGNGFEPIWVPDWLFDFQKYLLNFNLRYGRSATFADCGMGKTPLQLAWAENVVRKTNRPVLILTPLAVAQQTVGEGVKFGVEVTRTAGKIGGAGTYVANYEKLHLFDPAHFGGVVCDESSAIKNFDGKRKAQVTEFLRTVPYRLFCTATAAPNDYPELGTSSEALGYTGYVDMLTKFFKNTNNTIDTKGRYRGFGAPRAFEGQKWRFKGHAEEPFWRWVASWARACRRPSDLGFSDDGFALPPLIENAHVVEARRWAAGTLFPRAAIGMREEREERRRTIEERCERVATLVDHDRPAVVWCHLNPEGDRLAEMIPGSRQVRGSTPDEEKEETYGDFAAGRLRVLVLKPKIGAWGLNWQHCNHVVTFASHSYEQYYQLARRCWRFGQTREVTVDEVLTEGETRMLENRRRKSAAADKMFSSLVRHMGDAIQSNNEQLFSGKVEVPSWL